MRGGQVHLLGLLVGLSLIGGVSCRTKVDSAPASTDAPASLKVDLNEDRKAARASWLMTIARDPEVLAALAQTAPEGWRGLFTGEPGPAVAGFEVPAGRPGAVEARLGLARSALQLAEAHAALGELQLMVTPNWLNAWATRPGAADSADWRKWLTARLESRGGRVAVAADLGAESPIAPWGDLLAPTNETAEGKLLRGEAVEGSLPPPATDAYHGRLRAAVYARQGDWKAARGALRGVDPLAADFTVGDGSDAIAVRDPALAGLEAWIWAAVALAATADLPGWSGVVAARAELLLGRHGPAAARLKALLEAPPTDEPPLALLVLSGSLNAEDLLSEARGLLVEALVKTGGDAEARSLVERMSTNTVGRRVLRSRASSLVGGPVEVGAFPEDRDLLTAALRDEIIALGAQAKGADDVSQLALVDRYVDDVQRRFADALGRSGQRALAVKARQTAEDKASAMAPSARNTLPALAAAAADQLGIGQPRVALKYLGRMQERLPAASAPAEMLRDLLSLKAMEHDGSATAGQ